MHRGTLQLSLPPRVLSEIFRGRGLIPTTGGEGVGPRELSPEAAAAAVERRARMYEIHLGRSASCREAVAG